MRLSDYAALAKFQLPDGAFATYRINNPKHGWGRGHPDVTAVALRTLGAVRPTDHVILRRGFAHLSDHLRGRDPMSSYWWPSRFYLARELLLLARALPNAPYLSLPHIPAVGDGGCFDQAFGLEVAVLLGDRPEQLALLAQRCKRCKIPMGVGPRCLCCASPIRARRSLATSIFA